MSNSRMWEVRSPDLSPRFDIALEELQKLFDKRNCRGTLLEAAGKATKGFKCLNRPKTRDNYKWFWALEFKRENEVISVRFPWAQNWNRIGDMRLDRPIAIYTSDLTPQKAVNDLIRELTTSLEKLIQYL